MSTTSDLAIFERAVEARGRLLRVEADRAGARPRTLALTFDVGRIVVSSAGDSLATAHAKERAELPGKLATLDEEDPWWRVLGQPLTAAWPGDADATTGARSTEAIRVLKLRFREETENPRVIVLEAEESDLRVRLEA
jgi:hypothetical protein